MKGDEKILFYVKSLWGFLFCVLFGFGIWFTFDTRWLPIKFIISDIQLLILVWFLIKSIENKIEEEKHDT